MGRGRKPNFGKHKACIFYLPVDLHQKLKNRTANSGESASKFVTRLLRRELVQETKTEEYHNFFIWGENQYRLFKGYYLEKNILDDHTWYTNELHKNGVLRKTLIHVKVGKKRN